MLPQRLKVPHGTIKTQYSQINICLKKKKAKDGSKGEGGSQMGKWQQSFTGFWVAICQPQTCHCVWPRNSERKAHFSLEEITEAPRAQVHPPSRVAALTATASRQHLALMHSLVLETLVQSKAWTRLLRTERWGFWARGKARGHHDWFQIIFLERSNDRHHVPSDAFVPDTTLSLPQAPFMVSSQHPLKGSPVLSAMWMNKGRWHSPP